MDVAPEAVLMAQYVERLGHELAGGVRIADDTRAQEQPFNVVAAVEAYREVSQFTRGKGSARYVLVAGTVDAVRAIVGARVGHEHLQQRDAPAIWREAVAAARHARRA